MENSFPTTSNMWNATYHMSHVTCHVSHVMCHMFFWTKWWSLSVEGLLSTRPTRLVFQNTNFQQQVPAFVYCFLSSFVVTTKQENVALVARNGKSKEFLRPNKRSDKQTFILVTLTLFILQSLFSQSNHKKILIQATLSPVNCVLKIPHTGGKASLNRCE